MVLYEYTTIANSIIANINKRKTVAAIANSTIACPAERYLLSSEHFTVAEPASPLGS